MYYCSLLYHFFSNEIRGGNLHFNVEKCWLRRYRLGSNFHDKIFCHGNFIRFASRQSLRLKYYYSSHPYKLRFRQFIVVLSYVFHRRQTMSAWTTRTFLFYNMTVLLCVFICHNTFVITMIITAFLFTTTDKLIFQWKSVYTFWHNMMTTILIRTWHTEISNLTFLVFLPWTIRRSPDPSIIVSPMSTTPTEYWPVLKRSDTKQFYEHFFSYIFK